MTASDFQASVYLTDYRGTDRDEVEIRAANAASTVLRDHGITFEAALAAAADRANGEIYDAFSAAGYDEAFMAAEAAAAADLACAPGAFVNLGWR